MRPHPASCWCASCTRTRLKASGFHDLESAGDRDGPLSDRGNLHTVTDGDGQHEQLAERIETGAAYHTWANDVLRTHRFTSATQKAAWASHAAGVGVLDTARALGTSYHAARMAVVDVKAAIALTGEKGEQHVCENPRGVRRLVRQADPGTLLKLAMALLQA